MNPTLKKIFIIVVIGTALFLGYTYLFPSLGSPAPLETQGPVSASSIEGREFLATLVKLQNINIDIGDALFKDKAFSMLKDMSVSLPDEPKGRVNPFKPIGEEEAAPISATIPTSQSSLPSGDSPANPLIPFDLPAN